MRILLVNDFYSPYLVGGAETVVRQLASGLQKRGHIVSVITAQIQGTKKEEIIDDIHVSRIGSYPTLQESIRRSSGTAFTSSSPEIRDEFGRIVHSISPAVIHFHNMWLLGPELMRIEGYRKGVTFHDYWPFCLRRNLLRVDGNPCPGPGAIACRLCKLRAPATLRSLDLINVEQEQRYINSYLQACNFCTAPSQYTADIINRFSSVQAIVVRNGIPVEQGNFEPEREDYILFAGHATRAKGIFFLQKTFSRKELQKHRLWIASDAKLPKLPNVEVIGWQNKNDLLKLMSRAACVVVPSLWAEPAPMVTLEAQSVGTPVIVSRIGGLPELLVEHTTGLTIPPGDENALISAFHKICGDKIFQSQVRQAGPEFVRRQHSIEKVLTEWETIYATNN